MPSPDWEDWLTEDALDIDFLEQVEAQHLTSSNKNEAGNAATRGLVTFECSGAALLNQKVGVEGSIVQSGALAAVIHGQSLCTWKELCSSSNAVTQDVPVVFQLPCSPDMLLFNRDHFINGVRQSINVLEQQCNKVSTLGLPQLGGTIWTTAEQLRQQVVMLYNCLWRFLDDNIKTSLNDSNQVACKSVCADVIGDILDLLNYIGPLSELNQHVTSAVSPLGNQCPSAAYHLFHLHLDIRWWSLAILYMLETRLGSLPVPPSHSYCSGPPLLREPLTVMASSNTAHEAQSMMASGLSDSDGHFTQCVVFVLWDLMTLMARQVSKASLSMPAEDGRQGAGLPCSCSHEVALTVLLLSQQHHQDLGTSSFWDLLRPRLLFLSRQVQDSVLSLGAQSSSLPQLPPAELKGIHPALPFEILLTFAKCLCFNEHGHAIPSKDPRMVTAVQLLVELLNHLLTERPTRHQLSSSSSGNSSGGSASVAAGSSTTAPVKSSLPEESMRRVMRCCVHLTSMWMAEPRCLQVAMLLWEKYFARNLDSSFLLTGANSMHGLACVSSQAREWVVAARQRSSDPTQLSTNESSWNLFLRIVGVVVRCGGQKAWVSVKGRVLAKLSGRRMSELTSSGIFNTASLLLTLALAANTLETGRLACELLCSAVNVRSPSLSGGAGGRLVMTLRAAAAVLLLLAEADCALDTAGAPLMTFVSAVAQLHTSTRDILTQREAGRALCAFCAAAAEVCCSSRNLALGQHRLFDGWLEGLLGTCSCADLQQLLVSITTSLAPVLYSAGPGAASGDQLVASIERSVGSFLLQHSTTQTPPEELSDAAAALTLAHAALATFNQVTVISATKSPSNMESSNIACKVSGSSDYRVNHKEAASVIFNHFLCSERVNIECQLRYLSVLLLPSLSRRPANVEGRRLLVTEVSLVHQPPGSLHVQEEAMVSRFFCYVAALGSDNTQLLALVAPVMELGVVRGFLPNPPACPFAALLALVKALSREHQNAATLASKHQMQRCCMSLLQGLDKAVVAAMQQTPPPSHLAQLLATLADAVLHAPYLLYNKSKGTNCPLGAWLSCIVLTKASYKLDSVMPLHITRPMQQSLPKFVLGLCSLPVQQDAFLSRLVRSVLTNYMHRYPATPQHPCVVMLCGLDGADADAVDRLRAMMLTLLKTEFLTKKWGSSLQRLHIALQVVIIALNAVDSSQDHSNESLMPASSRGARWCSEAVRTLLSPLLQLLLVSDDKTTTRCISELLRAMFVVAQRRGNPDLSCLVSCVGEWVAGQLSWQSSKVFAVLTGLSLLHAPLVRAALPSVLAAVADTEQKRGTGVDVKLREMYAKLELRASAPPVT